MEKVEEKGMKLELCKIANHNSIIVAVCTNALCQKQPFCCAKCMAFFHQKCGSDLIFLEDIYAKKPDNLLSHPKFEGIKKLTSMNQGDKTIVFDVFKTLYLNSVIDELHQLKQCVDTNLDIVKEKVKTYDKAEQEKNLTQLYDTFQEKTKEESSALSILNIEEVKENIKDFISVKEKSSVLDKKVRDYFQNYFQDINKKKDDLKNKFWDSIVATFSKKQIHASLSKFSSKFKNLIQAPTLVESLFTSAVHWNWDPNRKHENIDLLENNTVAKKKGNADHTGVFGTIPFEQGIHIWEIKCEGITADNGDWIQFGVIEEEHYPIDYNNSTKAYSIASANYFGNGKNYPYNMEVDGPLVDFNDKTFRCEYDADTGILKITGHGIVATTISLKGKKVYPFVNVYHPGNQATLKIIQ